MRTAEWHGLTAALLACVLAGLAGAVQAFPQDGVVEASDPLMSVVTINTPACSSQGVLEVHHDVYPFHATVPGEHLIGTLSENGDATLYIHEGSFDPAASFGTCIAASNSGAPLVWVSVSLQPGVQYFAVVINDTFDQEQAIVYTLDVLGPGAQLGPVSPVLFRDGFEAQPAN